MVAALAGDQWNEGDVSCSVVRRVALPGAVFAFDGLMETFLTVVGEMEILEARVATERRNILPFLATTTVLMKAVAAGAGRETAHEAIKEHAVAAARALRSGEIAENDLLDRLAGDSRIGLDRGQLAAILERDEAFVGNAMAQVDSFVERVDQVVERVPEAREIVPAAIL